MTRHRLPSLLLLPLALFLLAGVRACQDRELPTALASGDTPLALYEDAFAAPDVTYLMYVGGTFRFWNAEVLATSTGSFLDNTATVLPGSTVQLRANWQIGPVTTTSGAIQQIYAAWLPDAIAAGATPINQGLWQGVLSTLNPNPGASGVFTWSTHAPTVAGIYYVAHGHTLLYNFSSTAPGGFGWLTGGPTSPENAASFAINVAGPVVNIATPADNPVYVLNQVVAADYTCTDGVGGSAIASCVGTVADGVAIPTGTLGVHEFNVATTDNWGNAASATESYSVAYDFGGFFAPVENVPTVNVVQAGRAIPIKFSLGGDQGLGVIATGYPVSRKYVCESGGLEGEPLDALNPGSSGLSYDPVTEQYNFVWKTEKSWGGTCREFKLVLVDGTAHTLQFRFMK